MIHDLSEVPEASTEPKGSPASEKMSKKRAKALAKQMAAAGIEEAKWTIPRLIPHNLISHLDIMGWCDFTITVLPSKSILRWYVSQKFAHVTKHVTQWLKSLRT